MKTDINWTELCRGCGACCGPVPFPRELWAKISGRVVHPVSAITPFVRETLLVTGETLDCVFLTPDKRCAIYEDRPEVCRLFGMIPRLPCPKLKEA